MEYMYSIGPKGTLHGRIHLSVIGNLMGATLISVQPHQNIQSDIMYPMGPKSTRLKEDQDFVGHGPQRYQPRHAQLKPMANFAFLNIVITRNLNKISSQLPL